MRFYRIMALIFLVLSFVALFFKAHIQAATCLILANLYIVADKILRTIEEK